MRLFGSSSMRCHAVQAAGFGADRPGVVRGGRAAGAALALAVLGGLVLASGSAQANTFPGTNGVIFYSAEVGTQSSGSYYEIVSKSTSGGYMSGTEYRCTVNDNTDVMPKVSKDGKMIAWLQDQNVTTMSLASDGQCPYNMNGTPRAGITPDTPETVTTDNLDSWMGGWSRWEESDGTESSSTSTTRKAWLFFSRRVPAVTTTPTRPANFEVYKVQVDTNGEAVSGSLENVTNYHTDPAPASQTVGITDSQPDLCSEGSTSSTRKLVWTSNRTGGSGKTDIWEQALDVNYDPTGTATILGANVSTAAEEGAATYKPGDCSRIAFQTDRDTATFPPLASRNLEIYRTVSSISSTPITVKRLTYNDPTLDSSAGLTDVTGYDVTPQWSPDAAEICFHSGRADDPPEWQLTAGLAVLGQWEVYTLDAVNGEYDATDNPGGTASKRETRREFNDERCGWQEAP